jgi:hypothetical protein
MLSAAALADILAEVTASPVTAVTAGNQPLVTENRLTNQEGYPGYRGYREKETGQGENPATDGTPEPDPDPPRRLWLIAMPTGEVFSSSFFPSATREEVQAWYPTAKIEPEPEEVEPAALVEPTPVQQDAPPRVACAECRSYRPDQHGFGGLGSCRASAPASKRPGSLWPNSKIRCNVYAPIEGTRNV